MSPAASCPLSPIGKAGRSQAVNRHDRQVVGDVDGDGARDLVGDALARQPTIPAAPTADYVLVCNYKSVPKNESATQGHGFAAAVLNYKEHDRGQGIMRDLPGGLRLGGAQFSRPYHSHERRQERDWADHNWNYIRQLVGDHFQSLLVNQKERGTEQTGAPKCRGGTPGV